MNRLDDEEEIVINIERKTKSIEKRKEKEKEKLQRNDINRFKCAVN